MDNLQCHICGGSTEFTCGDCGWSVCEDCCVVPTFHNQIEYTKCQDCEDSDEMEREEEWKREYEKNLALKKKKEAQAAARRANYRKPENVTKRRLAKIERKRVIAEQQEERMKRAMKIVSDMFRF